VDAVTTAGPAHPARAIVALDVPDQESARAVVARLGGDCDFYKVGMELFAAEGPPIVRWLREQGKEVFLDLKFHDIPTTVRGACRSAARLGVRLVTVHAYGGPGMLAAAVEGAGAQGDGARCGVLAVSVLTSHSSADLASAVGRPVPDLADEVLRLADLARAAGAHGLVCSGHEVTAVRSRFGAALRPLVPGVRLAGDSAHDQARVVTPGAAAAGGARYVVLGRTVTGAADPRAALSRARQELDAAPGRGPLHNAANPI
jgi:orotidine-5'-phosphate decarboxylase